MRETEITKGTTIPIPVLSLDQSILLGRLFTRTLDQGNELGLKPDLNSFYMSHWGPGTFCPSSRREAFRDFPGGAVVKSACQCRGHGFDLWSGKIPHAVEQLSPWATATEAPAPTAPCSTTREATVMRSPRTATKSSPRSPQLDKARVQQRRTNAEGEHFLNLDKSSSWVS